MNINIYFEGEIYIFKIMLIYKKKHLFHVFYFSVDLYFDDMHYIIYEPERKKGFSYVMYS